MTPSQPNTEKWTIGNKSEYATHNPSIIFDETGNAVADVYGVPLHATLEDVQREPRNAKALARAYLIAAAPRMLAALKAIVGEWEAERLEWIENRPEVLSLQEKQTGTPDELFGRARAAIQKAESGQ